MHRPLISPSGSRRLLLMLALLLAAAMGCGLPQRLRGPGFEEDPDTSLRRYRPPGSSLGDVWGFSTKARQIESDLGVD